MQLDLFAQFQAAEQPPVVQPVYRCSMREFRECQEIERDFFDGRAAWLYKQIEREMAQAKQAAKLESKVFAEGWK